VRTDSQCRSRDLDQQIVPAQSDQLVSSIRCQRVLLASFRMVRSSNHLSLRHSNQRLSALPSRHLCLYSKEPRDQLRSGLSGGHHLLRFCRHPRTDLIHHHCRDVRRPSSRFEHRCRSRRLLCRGNPDDLSRLADAQPDRMGSRRQVWVRLGWHRLRLLDYGLLLPS
jgi:hypothetical protein